MTRVVAQGTFDLLHTGHLHYLEESAAMGDELIVIVSRSANVTHKPSPILPARQRRELVDALQMVDRAVLGHESDIFVPIEDLEPDVIVLGHDQHHDETSLEQALGERGITCEIRRASPRPPAFPGEVLSTSEIVDRILEQRDSS